MVPAVRLLAVLLLWALLAAPPAGAEEGAEIRIITAERCQALRDQASTGVELNEKEKADYAFCLMRAPANPDLFPPHIITRQDPFGATPNPLNPFELFQEPKV